MASQNVNDFFARYDEKVFGNALQLRNIILTVLPDVTEQLDLPAKMVAYSYGNRYVDMICTIIPSKKGIKLGFYKGTELPDPARILEGTGKISRYVNITSEKQIDSAAVKELLK